MMKHSLIFARAYESEEGRKIPVSVRPVFHLTPWIGWMNDPNGFSYYQGQYHLFYQYNPYDTQWDAMHWGHAVSPDLLHWTYLPASLAPDAPYVRPEPRAGRQRSAGGVEPLRLSRSQDLVQG